MGKNLIREEILGDTTWTCPQGVTSIKLRALALPASTFGAGYKAGFGIDARGAGWAWGANNPEALADVGQLGTGETTGAYSSPVLINTRTLFRSIVRAGSGSIPTKAAVDIWGRGIVWGFNAFGQVGDGTTTNRSTPQLVGGGTVKFRQITGNGASFWGLTPSGQIYGWGLNSSSLPLGVGDFLPRSSPTLVVGSVTFRQISSNVYGGLSAISVDNQGYYLGPPSAGGNNAVASSPTLMVGGISWRSVYGNCGVSLDGKTYAWGGNSSGELGVGNTVDRSSPTLVVGGKAFSSISIGFDNTDPCVVGVEAGTGLLYGWGVVPAILGLTTGGFTSSSPVLLSNSTFVSDAVLSFGLLAANAISLYVQTQAGDVRALGYNGSGQLGNNSTTNSSSPVLVGGPINFMTIKEYLLTELDIPVTPGGAYAVRIMRPVSSFGVVSVYTDPTGEGIVPHKFVLEYLA